MYFTDLIIPKVKNKSNLFYGCFSLLNVDLSKIKANSISSMENMFYECTSLISLDLSNNEIASVSTKKNMFFGCYNLTIIIK